MSNNITFINPESEQEKRQSLIESVDNYADTRLSRCKKQQKMIFYCKI